MQVQNIIATFNLGTPVDVRQIALKTPNVELKPNFKPVIMQLRKPRGTALIFSSGKVVCTGTKTIEDSLKASRRFGRIIQNAGFDVKFSNFQVYFTQKLVQIIFRFKT